jgi:hypothetical protein
MKAYKGFNKDMTCRGFQFEEGKEYHEDNAELCESGFHACENPLDCFNYYSPADSVYHEVELDELSEKKSDDSKICGKHIKIGARLNILNIANLAVEYINSKIDDEKKETNTGDCSAATNTGNRSAATNTGDCSAATNTGNYSAATNTGDCSAATNTGYQSAASVEGRDSVAISTGIESKAKASLGSAICICERGEWNGETYPLLAIKAAIIDGERIKPDTWYKLKNGEFIEVDENEN